MLTMRKLVQISALRRRRQKAWHLLPGQARQQDATSDHAFLQWKKGQIHGPDGLPEAAAELPSRYRMPYVPG
ncbi:UNVERIFIED_ORG: hypothetical protein ABIB52_002243 [Arthrobacter sp. UYCu721]